MRPSSSPGSNISASPVRFNGLIAASPPLSDTSGKVALTPRQQMQEAARRIRESNTAMEYSQASVRLTPQPRAARLPLSSPRPAPKPAPAPKETIEISSSDSSATTSSSDDDDDDDEAPPSAPATKPPPTQKKPPPTPTAPAPPTQTQTQTPAPRPAARKRDGTSNAALIRDLLRKQAGKTRPPAAAVPAPAPKPGSGPRRRVADEPAAAAEEESAWKQAMGLLRGKSPARPNPVGRLGLVVEEDGDDGEVDSEVERVREEARRKDEKIRELLDREGRRVLANKRRALERARARERQLEAEIEEAAWGRGDGGGVEGKGRRGAVGKSGGRGKKGKVKSREVVEEGEEEEEEEEEGGDADPQPDDREVFDGDGRAAEVAEELSGGADVDGLGGQHDRESEREEVEGDQDGFDDLFDEVPANTAGDEEPLSDNIVSNLANSSVPEIQGTTGNEKQGGRVQSNGQTTNGVESGTEKISEKVAHSGVEDGDPNLGGSDGQEESKADQTAGETQETITVTGSSTQTVSTAPTSLGTINGVLQVELSDETHRGYSPVLPIHNKDKPISLRSLLAEAAKEQPKRLEEDKSEARKAPDLTAREVAQRNAARREQALINSTPSKPPQPISKPENSQNAALKTQTVRPARPAAKPKSSAFMPAQKSKAQAASQAKRYSNTEPLPRESDFTAPKSKSQTTFQAKRYPNTERLPSERELMSPKPSKRNSMASAPTPSRRPLTVLNDPNSTDFGPIGDKTPATPYSVIDDDDKQIHHWKEKGLKWAEICTLYAALTGKKFTPQGLQFRLKRIHKRFPELKQEKDKKELKGLPALAAAQANQAPTAEEEEEDEEPHQPIPLGGKKWNPDAWEQHQANQQALADYLTSDSDCNSTTPSPSPSPSPSPPPPLAPNEPYFTYHVHRLSTPTASPAIAIGPPAGYTSLHAANRAAGAEILLPRFGAPGAGPASRAFGCAVDPDGLHAYHADGVRVWVERVLRCAGKGGEPGVVVGGGWVGRRAWVVCAREVCAVGGGEGDGVFGEARERRSETRAHRVLGAFTVLDAANREAGAALLDAVAPRSARIEKAEEREEMRKAIAEEVDELEGRGQAFKGSGEMAVPSMAAEGAEVEFEVWVEEVGLMGPRNV
ncbi:hypothetical protein GTA08_BOTSDO00648 [Neofusicoccum parvum]|uniref:Uncharacterized protein n=1 Tax=Neofusicoccum parvum TaxID=310453 RepID=A0ACB5SCI6_9PEZI|nr:hypothetical protein GTA08_BOTSDO00648 [Neofusicoccum parvum]